MKHIHEVTLRQRSTGECWLTHHPRYMYNRFIPLSWSWDREGYVILVSFLSTLMYVNYNRYI